MKYLIVWLLCTVVFVQPLYGDRITLTSGDIIEGVIIKASRQTVTIGIEGGEIDFKKSEIVSIAADEPEGNSRMELGPSSHSQKNRLTNKQEPQPPSSNRYTRESQKSVASSSTNKLITTDVNVGKSMTYFLTYFGGEKNFRIAFKQYVARVKDDPTDMDARYKLGLSFYYLQQYKDAAIQLDIVLDGNLKDIECRRYLAHIYYQLGNLPMAIDHCKTLLSIRPENKPIRTLLANCYYEINEMELAKKEFEMVLSIDPDNVSILRKLAKIYTSCGKEKKAKIYRDKADTIAQTLSPA